MMYLVTNLKTLDAQEAALQDTDSEHIVDGRCLKVHKKFRIPKKDFFFLSFFVHFYSRSLKNGVIKMQNAHKSKCVYLFEK